jgi:hypothetical protein
MLIKGDAIYVLLLIIIQKIVHKETIDLIIIVYNKIDLIILIIQHRLIPIIGRILYR